MERSVKVDLVVGVDPQLERHSSSKLVPFVSSGNVVGVDFTLDVDVLVGSYVQELDSDQRLRVVDLPGKTQGRVQRQEVGFQRAVWTKDAGLPELSCHSKDST